MSVFNKMCDLLFAHMHAVHLQTQQMVPALHQEWNVILYDFFVTVKATLHECVIRTGQP